MNTKFKPLTKAQRIETYQNPASALRTRRAYEIKFDRRMPPPGDYQKAFEELAEAFDGLYATYKFILTMSNDPNETVTPFERKEK